MSESNKFYEEHFDCEWYATACLSDIQYELKWIAEDFFHRLFAQGKLSGQTMLDVGSGPMIRDVISASAFVPEIYLSDLLEINRKLIKRWLNDQPDSPDYSVQFKYVAQLEGQTDIKILENRVKNAIKNVIHCDILADNPLHLSPIQKFDILTSCLCLDCFVNDDDYEKAMKNLSLLLRPGGHLALVTTLECTEYRVRDTQFPSAYINEEKIRRVMSQSNLKIIELQEERYLHPLPDGYDNKGYFLILATTQNH